MTEAIYLVPFWVVGQEKFDVVVVGVQFRGSTKCQAKLPTTGKTCLPHNGRRRGDGVKDADTHLGLKVLCCVL